MNDEMFGAFIGAIMMQVESMNALSVALQETNRILAGGVDTHRTPSPELSVIHGGDFPDDLNSYGDYDPEGA